jgi:hypothetical protein
MVERTINIKGVELTKSELEEALDNLNIYNPGDVVRYKGGHSINEFFIVVHDSVGDAIRTKWPHIRANELTLIGLTDGNSYSPSPKFVELVRKRGE